MIRVLIVEDDPMVGMINKNYVESVEDFAVLSVASSYLEAIDILRSNKVDLVLLDIYLPKGDGISILRELRRNQYRCDVIMVTASSEIEKIDESLRLGVFDYLIKPFEYERLRRSLEDYKARYELLNTKDNISQQDLDRIFLSISNNSGRSLQKGLNQLTLNRVSRFMDENAGKALTAEDIAGKLGLTK
ncbi:MAG: response regulator, partial [Tissierellia bacterium]|nr:response regulator [Tissierellia bacterium]